MELLTSSRLRSARGCQRHHHIAYELGIRPRVEAEALHYGTLIHRALEVWWQGHDLDAALAAMAGEADPFILVRAEESIRGYHFRWKDEPIEVLAVEAQFETALLNPKTGRPSTRWRLGGKVDGIVREDGQVLVMEHKTASGDITPGSPYWARLRMDGQVSVYYDGALALGYDVEGCLYDVLGKVALRPYKATPPEDRKYKKDGTLYATQRETDETPEDYRLRVREAIAAEPKRYYQRGRVVRLEEEMKEARLDTWQAARQIREARVAGIAPRNPGHCMHWGRACEYFEVCSGAASLDDPALFHKLPTVHPELSDSPAVQPQ